MQRLTLNFGMNTVYLRKLHIFLYQPVDIRVQTLTVGIGKLAVGFLFSCRKCRRKTVVFLFDVLILVLKLLLGVHLITPFLS